MPMQDIQSGNQELMGIMLFVTGEVLGMRPDEMQQSMGHIWGMAVAHVEFLYFFNNNFEKKMRRNLKYM